MIYMDRNDIDEIVGVLTKLLIRQDFIDKKKGKKTYIKKTQVYKDLIKYFKDIKYEI